MTLDGEVLGTPQYMPPEQAKGRMSEVDERSDVYSLGAILYEILTFRPPYEGAGQLNILAQVMSDSPKSPSERISEIRSLVSTNESGETILLENGVPDAGARDAMPLVLPDEIPKDLEEIVMKAMARRKEDRFSSAMEVYDEVQKYLEGEKEAKRNREKAHAKVDEGRAVLGRNDNLRREYKAAKEELDRESERVKPFWPIGKKRRKLELKRKCAELEDAIVRSFAEATSLFQAAFDFAPGMSEAREALADMYWEQYVREEGAGDRPQMITCENMVRRYNDGKYDEKLKGDGRLSLSTRTYPCRCMTRGRVFTPAELAAPRPLDYHPFTASSLDGRKDGEGVPDLAPVTDVVLKMHSPDCTTVSIEGADAWIFRFVEQDMLMVPEAPDLPSLGAAAACASTLPPAAVLDALYPAGSPFRPSEGVYIGKTPVPSFAIPMGSYLLIIAAPGKRPVRIPVMIGRCAEQDLSVTLYGDSDVPEGFAQICAGKYAWQGDPDLPGTSPKMVNETDDFFMAVYPVTCFEYARFLNKIAVADPEAAKRHAPRSGEESGHYWPVTGAGEFVVPTIERLASAPELASAAKSLALAKDPWHERWPVMGISWEDAVAYAHAATMESGFLFTLPQEGEWEKTARGTDMRVFPWGFELDESFCSNNVAFEGKITPVPVDAFPSDESPYGVRGLGGNSTDPCMNELGDRYPAWRIMRGGSWGSSGTGLRCAYRLGFAKNSVYPPRIGIRLVLRPKW